MSLNDPQWGKRGNSGGPPDLDEIWRNVNRRMNALFGRKSGDEGGNGGGPPRRGMALGGAGLLVALVLLVWLASGFYIVDEGRRGVVTRFGKYTETTSPGPRWHLPYPVEAVELVDFSQVKTVEIGYRNSTANKNAKEATMLTEDENIIDIQFAVQYKLSETPNSAEQYVFNNRKPDEMVKFVAESAIREIVGKAKMDFALYEGREQIAQQTRDLMQKSMDRYKTGVYIQKVTLQSVQPPDKVQAAFDDAVKAGQDRVRLVNEGQAYANDVIPKARGMAARLNEEAEGYKQRVMEQAEGDAPHQPRRAKAGVENAERGTAPLRRDERRNRRLEQRILRALVDSPERHSQPRKGRRSEKDEGREQRANQKHGNQDRQSDTVVEVSQQKVAGGAGPHRDRIVREPLAPQRGRGRCPRAGRCRSRSGRAVWHASRRSASSGPRSANGRASRAPCLRRPLAPS